MKRHTYALACALLATTLTAGIMHQRAAEIQHIPDFMGHPLQGATPVGEDATFEVRHNCRIARFGVAPWLPKGQPKDAQWERMTRLWLGSIGMPRTGHDGAIAALRAPRASEVDVRNVTGAFDTTYRVGQRYVSCLGSTTRFGSDEQIEPADLHRYTHAGRTWDLAIIQRCGNVTLLPAVPVVPPVAVPDAQPGPARGTMVPYLPPGTAYAPPGIVPYVPHGGGVPPVVHEVPEPHGLALVGLAAAGLLFTRRK